MQERLRSPKFSLDTNAQSLLFATVGISCARCFASIFKSVRHVLSAIVRASYGRNPSLDFAVLENVGSKGEFGDTQLYAAWYDSQYQRLKPDSHFEKVWITGNLPFNFLKWRSPSQN